MYLANAFSLQMLNDSSANVQITEVDSLPDGLVSAIGHKETADILHVPFSRISIKLNAGDTLYVAQLTGGRLPEGCTKLPEGVKFKYFKVIVSKDQKLPSVEQINEFCADHYIPRPFFSATEVINFINVGCSTLAQMKKSLASVTPGNKWYVYVKDSFHDVSPITMRYTLECIEGNCAVNHIDFPEEWRGYHA